MSEANDYFVDTHAHLDLFGSNEDIRHIISTAGKAGVKRIVAIGDDLDSSRKVAGLTEQFARVYGAAGIHPHHADGVDKNTIDQIWAVSNQPKIVAIGETGLDFYRMNSTKESQISSFKAQGELSKHLGLALIIHCRDAYPELIDILKEMDLGNKRFVIHCFSGTKENAKELLTMGAYISFAGNVTFTNAKELRDVVDEVPLERILIETDSPYLAPHPNRGDKNEPALLPKIAETIASKKDIDLDLLMTATTDNAKELFNFN